MKLLIYWQKNTKVPAGYKLKANILYRKLADLERTPETLLGIMN